MIRIRKYLSGVALLVGAALLGAPTQARASFQVQVYEDGVAFSSGSVTVTQLNSNHWSIFAQNSDFTVNATANTQNPGNNGQLRISNDVAISYSGSGSHTITLVVTDTGYTLPTGTQVLLSTSGGGSYTGTQAGDSLSGTTMGFLDPTNPNVPFGNGFGSPIVVQLGTGAVAGNSQSVSSTTSANTGTVLNPSNLNVAQSLVYNPPTATKIVVSQVPFTLTNVTYFTFSSNAANSGDAANISNTVSTATVPVPAGILLVAAGAPCLAVGQWLRSRRRAKSA